MRGEASVLPMPAKALPMTTVDSTVTWQEMAHLIYNHHTTFTGAEDTPEVYFFADRALRIKWTEAKGQGGRTPQRLRRAHAHRA